jgi:hypothetical protein
MIQAKAEATLITAYQIKDMKPIRVIAKDRLAIVTAIHQVVTSFLGPLEAAGTAGHVTPLGKAKHGLDTVVRFYP